MSLLVVVAVAFVVFLYVRTTRQARRDWLVKLDLPGRWLTDDPAEGAPAMELTLHGELDGGEYVLRSSSAEGDEQTRQGHWRLSGHTLTLTEAGAEQNFDLHLFKPGSIGLEGADGRRQVLVKAADNVVPLRARSGAD